jgi:hypothetical protein
MLDDARAIQLRWLHQGPLREPVGGFTEPMLANVMAGLVPDIHDFACISPANRG